MVRPLVLTLATLLLAACTSVGGLPASPSGSFPVATAPTPQAAAGPAEARPTPNGCTVTDDGNATSGPVFVALADRGNDGVAFLLDRVTDRDVGELKNAGFSEDEIFEQTVSAATAAGLERLDAALRTLE